MTTDAFQLAVQRARQNYNDAEWNNLTFSDQARVIFLELRRIDAEALATIVAPGEGKPAAGTEDADLRW